MSSSERLRRLCVGGMAAGALLSSPLMAADETSSGALEEIVVTAQKRESNIQNTPVAVTAITAAALEQSGIRQVQDIAQIAPSVNVSKNYTTTIITIRGVSSRDTGTSADPAIAVSQDDFTIQRPYGLADTIYDLDRVEVLRGPQGTLYGRSATGGAVNFVSSKPTDQFTGRATLEYGDYNTLATEGMLNVPIIDTIDMRAAFATVRHDGYRPNEALGGATPGDDADSQSGRLQFLFKPIDGLKILLRGDTTHEGGIGPTTSGFAPIVGPVNVNYQPPFDPKGVAHGFPNQQLDMTINSGQLNVSYELPFMDISYIGGFRDTQYLNLRDLTGTASSANYFSYKEHPRDQSDEFRVSSKDSGRFTWQGGLFYFHEHNDQYDTYQSYAVAPPSFLQTSPTDQKFTSKAVFAQVAYEVIDHVKIEAGARYSTDVKDQTGTITTFGVTTSAYGHVSSDTTTYHAGIDWQITPESLAYAKYDTGFKPGGFGNIPGTFFTFGPEFVKSFELGSKNRFFDDRAQLNVAAYHYNYADQQVSELIQSGLSAGFNKTVNAGRSEYWGVEAEPVVNLTPHDRLNANVSWLDAYFTSFCTSLINGVCTVSYAGKRPVQAPTWQIGAGFEHDIPLPRGTLTPRLQTHFETQSNLLVQNYIYSRINKYTMSDAILTYKSEEGHWQAQGYVRNFENSVVITSANSNFGEYSYGLQPPRTYGIRVTYDFK